jgi:fructose-1,6-bisphosphatase/sedoheptulose 1,7-bisphosphatase-like protein
MWSLGIVMLPQVMTTEKKALASIAIQEKPSLFDTPSCFMAKATEV